jgi:hypothetical protein
MPCRIIVVSGVARRRLRRGSGEVFYISCIWAQPASSYENGAITTGSSTACMALSYPVFKSVRRDAVSAVRG